MSDYNIEVQRKINKNIKDDEFLNLLNTFGKQWINKSDLYAYFMGDKNALNKYKGD